MVPILARDARIYSDQNMTQPDEQSNCKGTVTIFSARSPSKQTPNEDAAGVFDFGERGTVLAVADGLGGSPAGQSASQLAIESLKSALESGLREDNLLRTAILNGLEQANQAVLTLGIGAATTLAVVEIQDNTVRSYHIGDSMILVVGQRGKRKLETTSHSPVGFAVESGLLDEQEAMFHEDRHLVSNVVGVEAMKIEIGPPVPLAEFDTLLLASDGLTDNLHLDEIVERIRKGPVSAAARRLVDDATARMTRPEDGSPSKPDDMTFILYRRAGGKKSNKSQ